MKLALLLAGITLLTPAVSRADKAAEAALDRCIAAETRAKTLQAEFSTEVGSGSALQKEHGAFTLKKPNVAHIVMSGSGGDKDVTLHSDGKRFTSLVASEKQFTREGVDPNGGNVVRETNSLEASVFFNPDLLNRFRALGSGVTIVSSAEIGGVRCRVLQVTGSHADIYKVYIGPDDLLRGVSQTMGHGEDRQVLISRLTNVRANGVVPAAELAWSPPRSAQLVSQIMIKAESGGSGESPGVELLAVGKPAPEFTLPQVGGGTVSLRATAKANKVTLVNFWEVHCVFCRAELPELNKMLTELKGKGVEILTVDTGDDAKAIGQVWHEGKFGLRALMDSGKVAQAYRVSGVPTNYVVGPDGKILARFEGFDEAGVRAAIAKAGVH